MGEEMPLYCTRCGSEATHADAFIADIHDSCEVTVESGSGMTKIPSEHDWEER